jgi:diacylglycerol kinase
MGLASFLRKERSSFGYALAGLRHAWRTQRHLRIHALLAGLAVGAGLALSLTAAEWAVIVTLIALVTALELLNTVIEVVVDLVTPEYHPLAKVAKDVAAGAVLIASLGAVAAAATLFLPRIARLIW